MTYIAIVAWTADNRLAKFQDYDTANEADAHVARVLDRFPGAFAVAYPGGGPDDWVVDPAAKTVSVVPIPPPPPPGNDELYDQNIQQNKVFKGYVLAVNDGSIVPGSKMTGPQLKAAVKAKM